MFKNALPYALALSVGLLILVETFSLGVDAGLAKGIEQGVAAENARLMATTTEKSACSIFSNGHRTTWTTCTIIYYREAIKNDY